MSLSKPNFDLGIESMDFSSSGDESILNIPQMTFTETEPTPQIRFVETTEEQRNKLLLDSEAARTKSATKMAVKLFKSIP